MGSCAAKEIHSALLEDGVRFSGKIERIKQEFMRECVQLGRLHYPNIVKMLGVCYLSEQAVLPVLVMELMDCSLKKMMDRCQNIAMYSKLSMLKDLSSGLLHLHSLKPSLNAS